MREVIEKDFRRPEFRDAKPEDYEFRADGAIVRKDRWENAVHSIRNMVGPSGREFEIDEVIARVRTRADLVDEIEEAIGAVLWFELTGKESI